MKPKHYFKISNILAIAAVVAFFFSAEVSGWLIAAFVGTWMYAVQDALLSRQNINATIGDINVTVADIHKTEKGHSASIDFVTNDPNA